MTDNKASLITVSIMVKNESLSIQSTLSSFFSAGIRNFFVLDTGSTDNTIQLVEDFLQAHSLTGYLQQEPFIDFASSRNRTLELAEQHFPESVFFLMPDAEWYLYHADELLQFCEQEKDKETPLYLVTAKMNTMEFKIPRLFRSSKRIRFKGVVHEVPELIAKLEVPAPTYIEVKSSRQGIEKSKQRWQQDLKLLAKACQDNPDDPRTAFYYAQTYECLGMLEQAYQQYLLREKINGWDEENFITCFRLGYLADKLSKLNKNYSWATAMEHYLRAFSLRPHRIEPLLNIAEHYWPNNIQTCYLFARHIYDLPYPQNDLLFVEKEMYIYKRYEIMSRCAWYMGEYALGEEATLRALQVHPNMEHLHRNLKLYQEKVLANVG